MTAIRGVKAGNLGPETAERFVTAADHLVQAGAQAIVAGCTEIPLVLHSELVRVPLIDPGQLLVQAVLARAGIECNMQSIVDP